MIKSLAKYACFKVLMFLRRIAYFSLDDPFDRRITIGKGTYGVHFNTVLLYKKSDRVIIGKYCSVGPGVKIIASGEHKYLSVANYPLVARLMTNDADSDTYSKGAVEIGNDVWIGSGAVILSGVRIGDGAVIAASAVVTDDIPAFAVAAGVPARVIRLRFEERIIRELSKIEWWDWDEQLIKARIKDFTTDIEAFIKKYSSKT